MKSLQKNVFRHQHYSIEDLIACPDLPALLEWGEFRWQFFFSSPVQNHKATIDVPRYLRQGSEFDPTFKEKETSSSSEKSSKKEKSTWSGLYTKMCVLFPYLWPRGKLGLQGMFDTMCQK